MKEIKKKIQVGYITPYPPTKGGVADYAEKLVTEVKKNKDIRLSVITHKNNKNHSKNIYSIISANPVDFIKLYKKVPSCDLIHMQFDFSSYMLLCFPIFIIMAFAKRIHKVTLVATYHEAKRDYELYKILSVVFYYFLSKIFDRIYVHTDESVKVMSKKYKVDAAKIQKISHGTYTFKTKKLYKKSLEKKLKLNQREYILFFGYIYKTKGIEDLIEAVKLLDKNKRFEDKVLIIAGNVSKRNNIFRIFQWRNEKYLRSLKEQVKIHKLTKKVTFVGYVEDVLIYTLFKQARIVVLPYTKVEQSGVLNIALASHTPAVATTVGGLNETLKNIGGLTPPHSPSMLADVINRLLTDNNAHNEIVKKYKEIAQREKTTTIADYLVKDYLKLAKNNSNGRKNSNNKIFVSYEK